MEWEATLKCKFSDEKNLTAFLNGLNALKAAENKKIVAQYFGLSDDESLKIIDDMLNDYDYTTALKYADIETKKDQLTLDYMTGSHEEFFIKDYFKLVLKLKGKPLKSVSMCDGGIAKYTYTYSEKDGFKVKVKDDM